MLASSSLMSAQSEAYFSNTLSLITFFGEFSPFPALSAAVTVADLLLVKPFSARSNFFVMNPAASNCSRTSCDRSSSSAAFSKSSCSAASSMAPSSSFISFLIEMYFSKTFLSMTISESFSSSAESNVGALCTEVSSTTSSDESQPPYFSPSDFPSASNTRIWLSIINAPTHATVIESSSSSPQLSDPNFSDSGVANRCRIDFNSSILLRNDPINSIPASLLFSVAIVFFSSSSAVTFWSSTFANSTHSIASPLSATTHCSFRADACLISFDALPAALKSLFPAAIFFSASRIGTRTSIADNSSFMFLMLVSAATTLLAASFTAASYLSTSDSRSLDEFFSSVET
mmetsp:Transcript_16696/g.35097  ORF Transcript_16696/g.35097 Transcript_16696/m.35097 type:complete len:345 (+) Transcript_16696:427-1461(+)